MVALFWYNTGGVTLNYKRKALAMADFIHLGDIYFNLDFVRQIFEDRENPGTWHVMLEMGTSRDGTGLVQALTFEGEEGAALALFMDNNFRNISEEARRIKGSRRGTPTNFNVVAADE